MMNLEEVLTLDTVLTPPWVRYLIRTQVAIIATVAISCATVAYYLVPNLKHGALASIITAASSDRTAPTMPELENRILDRELGGIDYGIRIARVLCLSGNAAAAKNVINYVVSDKGVLITGASRKEYIVGVLNDASMSEGCTPDELRK